MAGKNKIEILMFQSHSDSIKTFPPEQKIDYVEVFQSHSDSIKTQNL